MVECALGAKDLSFDFVSSSHFRFLFGPFPGAAASADDTSWDRVGILMTSCNMCKSAPSFSDDLTVKNALCRSGDILLSASSRTRVGSCKPARANSTKDFGSVAEKRRVCLDAGRA